MFLKYFSGLPSVQLDSEDNQNRLKETSQLSQATWISNSVTPRPRTYGFLPLRLVLSDLCWGDGEQSLVWSCSQGSLTPNDWRGGGDLLRSTNIFPNQNILSLWSWPPVYLHSCLEKKQKQKHPLIRKLFPLYMLDLVCCIFNSFSLIFIVGCHITFIAAYICKVLCTSHMLSMWPYLVLATIPWGR